MGGVQVGRGGGQGKGGEWSVDWGDWEIISIVLLAFDNSALNVL